MSIIYTGIETVTCGSFLIPILISNSVTVVLSLAITSLFFLIVLKVKAKKNATIPVINSPIYEDIGTVSKDVLGINANDAYNVTK